MESYKIYNEEECEKAFSDIVTNKKQGIIQFFYTRLNYQNNTKLETLLYEFVVFTINTEEGTMIYTVKSNEDTNFTNILTACRKSWAPSPKPIGFYANGFFYDVQTKNMQQILANTFAAFYKDKIKSTKEIKTELCYKINEKISYLLTKKYPTIESIPKNISDQYNNPYDFNQSVKTFLKENNDGKFHSNIADPEHTFLGNMTTILLYEEAVKNKREKGFITKLAQQYLNTNDTRDCYPLYNYSYVKIKFKTRALKELCRYYKILEALKKPEEFISEKDRELITVQKSVTQFYRTHPKAKAIKLNLKNHYMQTSVTVNLSNFINECNVNPANIDTITYRNTVIYKKNQPETVSSQPSN